MQQPLSSILNPASSFRRLPGCWVWRRIEARGKAQVFYWKYNHQAPIPAADPLKHLSFILLRDFIDDVFHGFHFLILLRSAHSAGPGFVIGGYV